MSEVLVQAADFDVAALQAELQAGDAQVGAVVCFTGQVRNSNEGRTVHAMELEHYPGMTERSIREIVGEAKSRWDIFAVRVVHRIGRLVPGEQIVFVGVSGAHRGEAFSACEFIMDYLKTSAPFWKREHGPDGVYWVGERESDRLAAGRWRQAGGG